jgi:hypothetical protein
MLILIPSYHPAIHPRAHRWTILAEHWAAQGRSVTVICGRVRGFPSEENCHGVRVLRCGFDSLYALVRYYGARGDWRGRVGAPTQRPGRIRRLVDWIYVRIWKKLVFPDDALFWIGPAERLARREIERALPEIMITVSLPFSAHWVGLRLKERYPNLRWLADIGDPFAIQSPPLFNETLYGRLARKLEKKVLESADRVAVTNPALRQIYLEYYQPAVSEHLQVIQPLLWPEPERVPHRSVVGKIRVVYAGALYPGLRTPDAAIAWLEAVLEALPDWRGRLELHWYGAVRPAFYQKLAEKPWIILHGLRPRAEVQRALATADLLLHIGNRSVFQLPSKAVDYLAAGRPILHFQYVARDPVLDFWPTELRCWKVRIGAFPDNPRSAAIEFIENACSAPTDGGSADYCRSYLPDRIGKQYLDWMSGA